MMLKSVLKFVFDNIGNPLSSKKISDTMTSLGRKINSRTVEKYLEAFSESYIIYPAKRYNIKGKEYLKSLEKYYIVDIGMRYMLLGSKMMDTGHILENVVYLEEDMMYMLVKLIIMKLILLHKIIKVQFIIR
ncbi:DUF4143 domain-containing protein [[Clostridium] ammoniilyticum]|uniref:DUF4143 domain-containing protein n=1 Tax=[Clostridium] ammoniilyticum TaxID=2981784 RepID=UPI00374DE38A